MRIFGFDITRAKAQPTPTMPVDSRGGWWPIIREPFTGAWQKNMELRAESVLTYYAVYACITLIADDISKLTPRLIGRGPDDVATARFNPAFSPVLRKPNHYQNRIQFFKLWVISKLVHGNTYVLKQRDARNIVVALYVLDPQRVRVLVAPDGAVFYRLSIDVLSGISNEPPESVTVPASEIIHDINAPFYHPLCGVSPLSACGLPALHGLNIEVSSAKFFQSGSHPGGILTAPGEIGDTQAQRFKEYWDNNFSGENAGKVAVLGGGLEYKPITINAVDSQLIEQLKWTAEAICSTFHVPPYMIGVGNPPNYNNIEALNQQYYSQCLQTFLECIELGLGEGLALPFSQSERLEVEFDLRDLLRMDTATKVKSWGDLVQRGIAKPNEARADFDLAPVQGGDTPYLQQQNYSLAALDKRDTSEDPFGTAKPPAAAPAADSETEDDDSEESPPPGDDGGERAARAVLTRIVLLRQRLVGHEPTRAIGN